MTQVDFSMFKDRPCPDWFVKPQLGIFIHWGMYAVPAWAPQGRSIHELMQDHYDEASVLSPYSEWYGNAMRVPGCPTQLHHEQTYGQASYDTFRPRFDQAAEAFCAQDWAQFFQDAGATYVVFVTKHHDGYCLWPTDVENPHKSNWYTKRDFVGELADAVRAKGMRFGIYYSGGLDWTFYHQPIKNMGEMLGCVPFSDDYAAYARAQLVELIDRYEPSIIWNDIAWPNKTDVADIFAHYYARVPDGVVNDRWLAETALFEKLRTPEGLARFNARTKATLASGTMEMGKPPHCDFRTIEYGLGAPPSDQKWEACRGVGNSFGYCSLETANDHLTRSQMLELWENVSSAGGNLLLNIGPMADGTIPDLQKAALLDAGKD